MSQTRRNRFLAGALFGCLLALAAWWGFFHPGGDRSSRERAVAAVAVGPVEQGRIERRRVFTGTLAPKAEFVVAPKVAGRVKTLTADLGDSVHPGDLVATLENDEFLQAVSLAEADLAVAQANLAEAKSALEIAEREMQRSETLRERGVTSEAQFDEARAGLLASQARLEVARAEVKRADANLATARIRLGYTNIAPNWNGPGEARLVAERYLDEGETVAANEPLLLIVQLDPLTAVVAVTERDYPFLYVGLEATFTTDAFPGEVFAGNLSRLAPVFSESTRQARVELNVGNKDIRLKPGMFVRVALVLEALDDVTIVPEAALTQRRGVTGVFLVSADGGTVRWQPVKTGIRDSGRVQILEPALTGRVVTLGQQLLDDGVPITIPDVESPLLSAGS